MGSNGLMNYACKDAIANQIIGIHNKNDKKNNMDNNITKNYDEL